MKPGLWPNYGENNLLGFGILLNYYVFYLDFSV